MPLPVAVVIAGSILISAVGAAAGQEVRSTTPECRRCTIERTTIAVLGGDRGAQDAAPLGLSGAITRPGGQILAIGLRPRGGPHLFGPDGRFLRSIGRVGQGPGEYVGAVAVLSWRGDSVLVIDPPVGRVSVLSPALEYVRSFPLPTVSVENIVALASGLIVLNTINDPTGSLDPIRVIDHRGVQVGSFGGEPAGSSAGRGESAVRLLATDGRRVWVGAPFGDYRLQVWDVETMQPGRRLVREASFARRGPARPVSPEAPPRSVMTGLYVERDHLWVLTAVAGGRWARGLARTPVRGETGVLQYRIEDPHLVYDTVVDAFDVRTGRLVASRRFDEFISATASAGRMGVIRRESSDGSLLTELVSFDLVSP